MKKALLVTLEYPPQLGGVANYYYNLVKKLPVDKIDVLDNKDNQLLSSFPILPWLKSFFIIKKYIKNNNIEVLLVGQILPLGTVAWLLSKFIDIPYIVFTHAMDITVPQKYPRKKWLMKRVLNSSEKIITVSRYTKYELLKIIKGRSQRKIEIISPAPNITPKKFPNLDINSLKQKYQDNRILLSVGRLVERKGNGVVIKALPTILKSVPNLKYVIIGEGEHKSRLKKLIAELKLEDKVIFKSELSDQEVAQYYQLCDLFIMPSREMPNRDVEGFGLVYLEANSFSKPVIGGKSGGVEDAIIDGETGFLVDPEDIDMIAGSVVRLLKNQSEASRLGNNGRNRAGQEFTWASKASQLSKILA